MNDRAAYANANAALLPLADKSVHMIATSPPYWGLRDYGTAKWEGGDPGCDHAPERRGGRFSTPVSSKQASNAGSGTASERDCRCGATRVDNQLGLERVHDCGAWARRSIIGFRGVPEFEEDGDGNAVFVGRPPEPVYGPPAPPCGACYVCNLRTWAAEMWRVLRDDGVMFLNLGDSYASNGGPEPVQTIHPVQGASDTQNGGKSRRAGGGLKAKDMAGIPWRVALALQADGWYLRSDCIWEKPNAMPSSVTDRPSTSHEYIFLLTKRPRYYWDNEAVKEPAVTTPGNGWAVSGLGKTYNDTHNHNGQGATTLASVRSDGTRNLRTVWTIPTAPYAGAHFATWPPSLVERMVKAGSSEHGVCPTCGAPWQRVVDKGEAVNAPRNPNDALPYTAGGATNHGNGATTLHKVRQVETVEWRPTCAHADAAPTPAIVLDPFCGSGTTLEVARRLGRIGLGFDLSETYLRDNAAVRLGHDKLAAWGRGIVDTGDYSDLFRPRPNGHGATE